MVSPVTVLVTGATGQQGGALARLLLKRGFRVRALTRKPASDAAEELKRLGAQTVTANFDDYSSLEAAARGIDAVFAMGTPFEAGTETERRQGKTLADAAQAAGVQHFVYTSVASADRNTGIPHFDSKLEIEKHVQAIGVPYTIIGPVFFMENLLSPWWLPGLKAGKLAMALPASRKLQQIALADIAAFSALVLERPESFLGKRVEIASDELTGQKAAEILSRVSGRKINYMELPLAEVREWSPDFAKMFEWFDRVGYSADIGGLRREHPEVGWHTFADWSKRQDWSVLR